MNIKYTMTSITHNIVLFSEHTCLHTTNVECDFKHTCMNEHRTCMHASAINYMRDVYVSVGMLRVHDIVASTHSYIFEWDYKHTCVNEHPAYMHGSTLNCMPNVENAYLSKLVENAYSRIKPNGLIAIQNYQACSTAKIIPWTAVYSGLCEL